MKNSFAFILLISILILNSCTQNNGYIGPIFGSWSLVEISEDGVPMQLEEETIFSFQNQVVQVMKYKEFPFVSTIKYGNFKITDDVLTLKFQLESTDVDNYMYLTPDWLCFPLDGEPINFDIKQLNGSQMVLTLDDKGKKLDYKFRKTW